MDNFVYIFAKDVGSMKFELTKYQRSNYQACSPANHMNVVCVFFPLPLSLSLSFP